MEPNDKESLYWRQLSIFDPNIDRNLPVAIIGCGGIGSYTAVGLTQLGIKTILLVDNDVVELHNRPNQLYFANMINRTKAVALASVCKAINPDIEVKPLLTRVSKDTVIPFPIIISAVDSMESRKAIWESVKQNINTEFFIDGRIGGNVIKIYCVNFIHKKDIGVYEQSLHSDADSVGLPCTAAGIVDIGFAVGSLITRTVRVYLKTGQYKQYLVYDHENLTFFYPNLGVEEYDTVE